MNAREKWEELQKLNKLPLNQLAKQALRSVNRSPDPGGLYLLQLVRWALDYGKVKLIGPGTAQYVLLETLDAFPAWNPKNVMQVFLENGVGDPIEIYPLGPLSAVKLAEEALEQLHSRLTEGKQDYPVARTLD